MNLFAVLVACVAGLYVISQAVALIAVFDYYFYLLPFGLALAGVFLAAGIGRLSLLASVNTGIVRTFPLFAGLAMLLGAGLYLFAPSLGSSLFFLSLIAVQLTTLVLLASVLVQEGRLVSSVAGAVIGVTLGYALVSEWNMDPLMVTLMAAFFASALYLARLLKKGRGVAYGLIVCCVAYAVYQGKQQYFMPAALGWVLDVGKAEPGNMVDRHPAEMIWGAVGLTEMYLLADDDRAAWVYTNASSPALALTGKPPSYDDDWWAHSAPLTTAIHDAVRPRSVVDIGMAPSDMVWRAAGHGERDLYGLYGSHDWADLSVSGLDFLSKSVVLLHKPDLSKEKKIRLPVDMVVVSSGHAGQGGWLSSGGGEQTVFDQENLRAYWQALDESGVLVLLSRQESVFLRQLFGVWSALRTSGMSDAEFLDRAWAIVPDAATSASPYRYALVLTKKARDEKFAQAIRGQVLKLPVRYLFGAGLPPSSPYPVLYQNDMNKAQAIFTLAASRMYGKYVTLEPSTSRRSITYQFVEDVFPQFKNMLVLSVGILLAIIIFPLQKSRQVERIQALNRPSPAVWLVTGGATGALMAVALAFLLVYPAAATQEIRLLCLAVLLAAAMWIHASGVITAARTPPLLAWTGGLVLMLYLANHFALTTADNSLLYVIAAGILLVLLGLVLLPVQASLLAPSEDPVVAWWWFSMAAGCAATLFWSMSLYSALGDGLFLIAGPLMTGVAAVAWWHSREAAAEMSEAGGLGGRPAALRSRNDQNAP